MSLLPTLKCCLPNCRDPAAWASHLDRALALFTPAETAAFLAQIAVESNELNRLVENLNYSALRLTNVWPRRFPTLESAQPYAGQPEKLGNFVYAGRLGNGPEASGDGYRYRGRGLLQITGLDNYTKAQATLRKPLVTQPWLLESPEVALASALDFWARNGLGSLCGSVEDFTVMSKKINGGSHGLPQRIEYWRKLRLALGVP